jgi:hypothetical protein
MPVPDCPPAEVLQVSAAQVLAGQARAEQVQGIS